jgi:ribosomal protein S1
MSDTETPSPAPQPEPEKPTSGADRLRNRPNTGKVPQLDSRDLGYGFGQPRGAFDAATEDALEADLRDAMGGLSDADMRQLYGEAPRPKRRQPGEKSAPRKGKVISVRGKDVFVDVGGRSQGVMTLQQFPDGPPAVGDEVEVYIEGAHPDGLLLLTREGAAVEADWSSVAVGMIVEARVTGTNKGGLSVDVNGIRGFMPASQVDLYRAEDLNQFVNQKLRCLVTEVDREDRNLLVSRRALQEKERQEQAEKTWAEIAEGQIREGVVRSIKPFGAFIDLGGVDGLLPTGEMSWQRVGSPEEVVSPGQRVRVQVLRLDPQARKVTLGLRQLQTSPWDTAPADYPVGTVARGKVTRTAEFGAFVEVCPGVEGLVHVSELAPTRVRRVADVVQVGQEVAVKVLSIDVAARRMSLSLKQASQAPEPPPEEEPEDGAPAAPPRKRTTPLRGGVGNKWVNLPGQGEKEG